MMAVILTMKVHKEYPEMLEKIHGISEETTTGVKRLKEMLKRELKSASYKCE